MAIIAPTIDEFDEPTVMLIIRNLVKWIQTDLVPQINANDIVSATQTSDGLSFEINLIKGDGTQIPVGKITLEDEDNIASGSFHFDNETRMLSGTLLKEDGTPINIPAVEIPEGSGTQVDYGIQSIQFTYQGNNLSCVITQNDGTQTTSNNVVIAGGGGTGGNPYPTAISGTVGEDGNITLSMTMSEGNPVTATINMSYFASAEDLEDIQTQLTAIKISTTVSQDSSNVIKVSNAVNGNNADFTLDLSAVDGEIILTAEDGINQAKTKIVNTIGEIPIKNIGVVTSKIDLKLTIDVNTTFTGTPTAGSHSTYSDGSPKDVFNTQKIEIDNNNIYLLSNNTGDTNTPALIYEKDSNEIINCTTDKDIYVIFKGSNYIKNCVFIIEYNSKIYGTQYTIGAIRSGTLSYNGNSYDYYKLNPFTFESRLKTYRDSQSDVTGESVPAGTYNVIGIATGHGNGCVSSTEPVVINPTGVIFTGE